MTRRPRTFAVLSTTLALMAVTMVPAHGATPPPVRERPDPHDVSLQWTGEAGFLTIDAATLGTLTVVPGGSGETTLLVRNDGPSAGTLTASIVDPEFLGAGPDDEFFRDLRINDIDAADLAHEDHVFLTVDLAQGATAEVPLRYEMSLAATSGNRAQVGERTVAFDVQLSIAGDTPQAAGTETGTAPAPGGPAATQPSEGSSDEGWSGSTALTGGAALAARTWMFVLATGLVVIALAAARARRRAPSSQEEV